jgi:hypothetical protein
MFDALKKMFGASGPPPRHSTTRPAGSTGRRAAPPADRPAGPDSRQAPRPQDSVLAPHAVKWLATLPRDARPEGLVKHHPRIVNKFALLWVDPVLAGAWFDSLMVDRRGGRKGFGPLVTAEILRLHEYFLSKQEPDYLPKIINDRPPERPAGAAPTDDPWSMAGKRNVR